MKTSKTFALLAVSLLSFACNAQKTRITMLDLPKPAQNFITENFSNQVISYAVEDKEISNTEYKVVFTGGAEIEFDGKGNWEEIDGHTSALPASVLPKTTAAYIAQHYKNLSVEKLEKERYGYKVEFTNDLELKFDAKGNFMRIDD
jgi:hypothetical protein